MSEPCARVGMNDEEVLGGWCGSIDSRRSLRAQIALRIRQGQSVQQIATDLGVAVATVYKWRRRYNDRGLSGLGDLPRSGQPRRLSPAARVEILRVTRDDRPVAGPRWTIRMLARHLQVTEHQVRSVWKEAGIAPAIFCPDPDPCASTSDRSPLQCASLPSPGLMSISAAAARA